MSAIYLVWAIYTRAIHIKCKKLLTYNKHIIVYTFKNAITLLYFCLNIIMGIKLATLTLTRKLFSCLANFFGILFNCCNDEEGWGTSMGGFTFDNDENSLLRWVPPLKKYIYNIYSNVNFGLGFNQAEQTLSNIL